MKTSINFRFLLASLLAFGMLGLATYGVNAYQVQRQAVVMLRRARQCQEEKQFDQALRSYGLYLELAPKDIDARADHGLLLADCGNLRYAASELEAVLRGKPDRDDLRRRLVELDLAMQLYLDAREHLRYLLDRHSEGKLWDQMGICQNAAGDYEGAVDSFQKAIAIDPKQCLAYFRLAEILRMRLDRDKEADDCIDQLVAANADSSLAHFLRAQYLYYHTKSREKLALSEAKEAAELDSKDARAPLLASRLAELLKDYGTARDYAQRAIDAAPALAEGYIALFRVENLSEHRDKAVEALRKGIEKASERRELLWNLGWIMIAQAERKQEAAKSERGAESQELDEAVKAVKQLRALPPNQSFDPVLVDYLQARIEVAQGEWYDAAADFLKVERQLNQPSREDGGGKLPQSTAPELLKDVECRLARCYEQLGDPEAQLAAYRKAAHIDPLCVPARLGVAATLSALGQVTEAQVEYEQIGHLKDMAATSDFEVARLLALKNLRLPESQRDWKKVQALIDRLKQSTPDATELTLLQAETWFGQKDQNDQDYAAKTEKLLTDARDKFPEKTEYWTALVSLACRRERWDHALELLAQAEKKFGDQVILRLARGQYLLARYGKKAGDDLAKLGADAGKFSAEDRLKLDRGLTMYLWETGDLERAKQLAAQGCAADTKNLAIRLLLFELTYLGKDATGMENVLAEIERFQPDGALWNYGEAVRLAVLAERESSREKQAGLFRQAIDNLSKAQVLRPGWARVPLLLGRLYDRLGDADPAIENYCLAIKMGEISPTTVHRAFVLLYAKQEYGVADEMLRRLERRQAVFFTELGRLASEVSMRLENLDRAVEISREVAEQSKDWNDHLWLGELQGLLGQRAAADQRPDLAETYFLAAEKSLRRAKELGPSEPQTWVGLIRFLASRKQNAAAETLLHDAIENIPPKKAALALGQCYEALGEKERATEQYHSILAKDPGNPVVLRNVAEFCLREKRLDEAEGYLQRILDGQVAAKPDDVAWAHRATAELLRQRGGYRNLLDAVKWVDQNLAGGAEPDDLREKAELLACFPQRAKRREAIAALEEVVRSQPSEMAEVRFSLANLYLRDNNWLRASQHMQAILANHGKELRYLAAYAAMLMDHNEMDEARLWLNQLRELAPDNSLTITLQAESLIRSRQTKQAIELLSAFVERPSPLEPPAEKVAKRDARILTEVSMLKTLASGAGVRGDKAAQTELLSEMEKKVRDYVTRHPDDEFLVAFALLQQGQVEAALKIAERTWPKAEVGALAAESETLIGYPGLTPAQIERLESILLPIADKKGRPVPLLLVIGDLRMRGRPQDAVEIYREILHKDKDNVIALNNLALLLALQKLGGDESLKLVDRAIAIAGPVPAMLDTRATVRAANGQLQEALADIDEVIRDDARAVNYFHRALIYRQLGRQNEAIEAFREARKLGIKPDDLLLLERADYDALAASVPP